MLTNVMVKQWIKAAARLMGLFFPIKEFTVQKPEAEAGTYLLSDPMSLMFQAKNRLPKSGCTNHSSNTFMMCLDDKNKKKQNRMRRRYVYIWSFSFEQTKREGESNSYIYRF